MSADSGAAMVSHSRTKRDVWAFLLLLLAGVGVGLAACGRSGEECQQPPCPVPLAIEVSVTAAGAGPVEGVMLRVSGAATGTVPCSAGTTATTCRVLGGIGTYNLEFTASGFQATQRSVTVGGTTPECGCPTIVTAHLDVTLSRSA